MAIELGALNLAIRDTGGAEVLNRLKLIDGNAKKLGTRPVRIPVSAPGATQAAAQLKAVATQTDGLFKTFLGASLVANAATMVTGAIVSGLMDTSRAYDDVQKAQRKLEASSKLTGAALADVQAIAKAGEETFRLSAGASADFTASVVKLTARAGELNKSGEFMARWLDLAAANGWTATDAMQALETTIIGQDEGLNKLGLSNPQQIYEAWAKGANTTAAKMDDLQKAQAIVNEIITKGGLVNGYYVRSLDTAAGKADELARKTEAMKAKLGEVAVPLRLLVYGVGTTLAGAMGTVITKVSEAIDKLEDFRAQLAILANAPIVGPAFALLRALTGDAAPAKGKAPAVTLTDITGPKLEPPGTKASPKGASGPTAAQREMARQDVLASQVQALAQIADLRTLEGAELGRAVELEAILRAEMATGNTTLERRAELLRQINDLSAVIPSFDKAKVRDIVGDLPSGPAGRIELPVELVPKVILPDEALEAATADVNGQFQSLGVNVAGVLGAAIATGFAGGDVGSVILQGLGSIMMQMGQALLTYGATMMGLLPAFSNPFTSGPAALAAGAALLALGGAIGGAARGTSGGSSSGSRGVSGSSSGALSGRETIADGMIRRATLPPGARPGSGSAASMPVGPSISVIGINTPQGQRLVGESAAQFTRRGGRG